MTSTPALSDTPDTEQFKQSLAATFPDQKKEVELAAELYRVYESGDTSSPHHAALMEMRKRSDSHAAEAAQFETDIKKGAAAFITRANNARFKIALSTGAAAIIGAIGGLMLPIQSTMLGIGAGVAAGLVAGGVSYLATNKLWLSPIRKEANAFKESWREQGNAIEAKGAALQRDMEDWARNAITGQQAPTKNKELPQKQFTEALAKETAGRAAIPQR